MSHTPVSSGAGKDIHFRNREGISNSFVDMNSAGGHVSPSRYNNSKERGLANNGSLIMNGMIQGARNSSVNLNTSGDLQRFPNQGTKQQTSSMETNKSPQLDYDIFENKPNVGGTSPYGYQQ